MNRDLLGILRYVATECAKSFWQKHIANHERVDFLQKYYVLRKWFHCLKKERLLGVIVGLALRIQRCRAAAESMHTCGGAHVIGDLALTMSAGKMIWIVIVRVVEVF